MWLGASWKRAASKVILLVGSHAVHTLPGAGGIVFFEIKMLRGWYVSLKVVYMFESDSLQVP